MDVITSKLDNPLDTILKDDKPRKLSMATCLIRKNYGWQWFNTSHGHMLSIPQTRIHVIISVGACFTT